eukprot:275289_1
MTFSFRGMFMANLQCQLLHEGLHSGDSALVRDSFHVLRQILDLIGAATGQMMKDLCVIYRRRTGNIQRLCTENQRLQLEELILNRTWRPQLSKHEMRWNVGSA